MASALQRASAVMASGTMVSRVLGFVKTVLLGIAIGGAITQSGDAFANGNQLPNTIYMLLAGGMLNAVLVPQIVKAAQGSDGGTGYINKVLTLVSVALIAITTVAMLAAPAIMWLLTDSWSAEQRALGVAFSYWCIPQIVFYGWYTVLGEVLNAKKVFGPFTWAPALANVIGIVGLVAFILLFGSDPDGLRPVTSWTPASIAVLAGSATLGVVAQALVLIVPWRKAGLGFTPDFNWRGVGLGQTGRIASWGLATVTAITLAGFVTTKVINSATGEGVAFQGMQFAWLVFMLPHSVIAVSLMTAHFTQLSEDAQSGRMAEFRIGFSSAARQVLMLMLFASLALFLCARYVARVMLPGANEANVSEFTSVLYAYAIGLAAYSMMFVAQRAFYAISDARTPFLFMSAQLVTLVALTIVAGLTVHKSLLGVVYATIWSLTTVGQTVLAFWLLKRKVGGIGLTELVASGIRYLIALVPAGIVGLLVMLVCNLAAPQLRGIVGVIASIAFAVVVASAAGLAYFGALVVLKAPEAKAIAARLRRPTRRP